MKFFKKHYEKIILSVVLLGLAAVLGFIPVRISQLQTELTELTKFTTDPDQKSKYDPIKLTEHSNVLEKLKKPTELYFGKPHNLVSPVQWQETVDKKLIKAEKGDELGSGAVQVKKVTPLYFRVAVEKVTPPSVTVSILRMDRPPLLTAVSERKNVTFQEVGRKGDGPKWDANDFWPAFSITLVLKSIQGPPENPEAWVFDRSDKPDQPITITKDKPFEEIVGYAADLVYAPENKSFSNIRVGNGLIIAGDTNKVVDIKPDKVVLSTSNGKQTELKP